MTKPEVTIVVACYNEGKILKKNVQTLESVLEYCKKPYEIIFVDDKSKDNTREIIKELCSKNAKMQYFFHEHNTGRGKTVTDGIRKANSNIVGFIDIDLETHARYIPSMVMAIENGADLATAWRIYKISLHSLERFVVSVGYHFLSKLLLGVSLKDTETGCKFFNRQRILPVLDEIKDNGWFWDTEIMVRSHLKNYKIEEIPTLFIRQWDKKSTVNVFKDSIDYLKKLVKFSIEIRTQRRK